MKSSRMNENSSTLSLSLAALGVVYGDIGTSPLYALREALINMPITEMNILGILSLIFWALIWIISVKYLIIVLRADNEGEGGILSLLALLRRTSEFGLKKHLFILSIFGAGLMLGDGMLTPAISVLSAVEGLNVAAPSLSIYILPIATAILIVLFAVQFLGTEKIGFMYGPIIFLWFLSIGILGAIQIQLNPVVLKAINPYYGLHLLHENGWKAYAMLGSLFLVVTGGEALYADLGHFGKTPIRFSWFLVALPGLLLCYFGQGAHILLHPETSARPFFTLAPDMCLIPLVILATCATVIASQAVISASFSLTKQAILLGLSPRLTIMQTSSKKQGQIYISQMNILLGIGTILLVSIFKSSSALAHAYGIAVNLVMLLTSLLIFYVAWHNWHWSLFKTSLIFSTYIIIELGFLGGNIEKVTTGGWMPIIFAMACAFVMFTWEKGMDFLRTSFYEKREDLSKIVKQLHYKSLSHLPKVTAIFITDVYDKSGGVFLHFLKLSRAIPEHVLIVNYVVENIPYVSSLNRFEIEIVDQTICQLTLHYGFMDFISIPQALYVANDRNILPFPINVDSATYMVEVPNIIASRKRKTLWFFWQEKLFAFLMRNYSANLNIEFYQLPYNRTLSIGTYSLI